MPAARAAFMVVGGGPQSHPLPVCETQYLVFGDTEQACFRLLCCHSSYLPGVPRPTYLHRLHVVYTFSATKAILRVGLRNLNRPPG